MRVHVGMWRAGLDADLAASARARVRADRRAGQFLHSENEIVALPTKADFYRFNNNNIKREALRGCDP